MCCCDLRMQSLSLGGKLIYQSRSGLLFISASTERKTIQKQYKNNTKTIQKQHKNNTKTIHKQHTNNTQTRQKQDKNKTKTRQKQDKNKTKIIFYCLITLLTLGNKALAVEGLWQPQQLPKLEEQLKKSGLQLNPKTLTKLTSHPMAAVISLGGCTASFVSPNGLVLTNHHCAYGSIQYNSKPSKNLLETGFLAKKLGEELPASPGSCIYVTVDVKNVTNDINKSVGKSQTKFNSPVFFIMRSQFYGLCVSF